ncbi:endonuclease/exonuclease/phosphatase family protein [Vibrio hippocampi]|uniref:Endonuclease/exonuclease/phosphatase domain-containing protein n=1 Tax=Vibrio hippocampi TaxID=654686 RepID=A0ABN8DDY0_9VIBR|nr:endonuclease/exonuclease/phosphatase family protein [Vibrio hippocampi]CAH0524963.1 hypothetical protein VHP8226_00640 [Vibrio hippocampi]
MKLKWFGSAAVATLGIALGSFQWVFSVDEQPEITSIEQQMVDTQLKCFHNDSPLVLDEQGVLRVLVWNIYKQNRPQLFEMLSQLSVDKTLVLLQEAKLDDQLLSWIKKSDWSSNQVSAFKAFDISSGVLNLSRVMPVTACANLQIEPWLRLPKSGLYAEYRLSNGQTLKTVNLHAINFTLGTEEYQQQLSSLIHDLQQHQGPLLIAGDFNSWSEARQDVIDEVVSLLQLQEVSFAQDNRTRFYNRPLDHVYYRGMTLSHSVAPETQASDHNPLVAEFSIQ